MAKKLPEIYQSSFSHPINNNKKIFYSYQENSHEVNTDMVSNNRNIAKNNNVDSVLQDLFNGTGYVFNIPVEIRTNTKTYNTKIATKRQNTLLTLDGDVILLSDIISIKRKDR